MTMNAEDSTKRSFTGVYCAGQLITDGFDISPDLARKLEAKSTAAHLARASCRSWSSILNFRNRVSLLSNSPESLLSFLSTMMNNASVIRVEAHADSWLIHELSTH